MASRVVYGWDTVEFTARQGTVNFDRTGWLEGIVDRAVDYNSLVGRDLHYQSALCKTPGSVCDQVRAAGFQPEDAFLQVSPVEGDPGNFTFRYFQPKRTEEEIKSKGFLGGATGGLVGGILAVVLAPTGIGTLALAGLAAAGAAGGTLIGSGAEAAITGTKFTVGDELQGAAISGGVAAVGVGVTSALGPGVQATTVAAEGAAQEAAGQAIVQSAIQAGEAGGFVANVTQEALGAAIVEGAYGLTASVTTPGLVSSGTAKALGGVASTVTKTALAPFVPMSASLSDAVAPAVRTVARPLPLSGGAVNTTGATWFNYGNTVDIPALQDVTLLGTGIPTLDELTDALKRGGTAAQDKLNEWFGTAPATPGAHGMNPIVAALAAAAIIGGAYAFARARR